MGNERLQDARLWAGVKIADQNGGCLISAEELDQPRRLLPAGGIVTVCVEVSADEAKSWLAGRAHLRGDRDARLDLGRVGERMDDELG